MAILTLFFALITLHIVQAELILPEDVGLSPLELITKYGYPLERHWVETEDGYILNMHRIPHGLNNADEENKPAVLLMHGLLSSGADFVNLGAEKSPGFYLADLGYDVWLGNARGTTYSRNHTTLSPDEREFWQYSWNEIGYYDLAAKIDYLIQTTGQEKVFYIGHSQGTTTSYTLFSQRPEYNNKVRLISSLAPVAYMSNMLNPIFQIASLFHEEISELFETLGWYEILAHSDVITSFGSEMCGDGGVYQDLCVSLLSIMGGYNRAQVNTTMIPVFMSNAPAGISYRQLVHYAQGIRSGYFRLYDFGNEENLNRYGQEVPPDYDLSQITAPVALFYTDNDWLAATVDVLQLHSELSNSVLYKIEKDPRFNHIDYIWAVDIIPLLYEQVAEVMSLH